jgi:hypothetical protein
MNQNVSKIFQTLDNLLTEIFQAVEIWTDENYRPSLSKVENCDVRKKNVCLRAERDVTLL